MPEFGRWASLDWFVALLGAFKAQLDGFGSDFGPCSGPQDPTSGATLQLSLQLAWRGCCRVLDRSEFERAERLSKGRSRSSCTPGRADLARPA